MGLDLSAGVYPPFVWRVWRTFLPKGNVTPDLIRDTFDIIKVVRNIAPYMLLSAVRRLADCHDQRKLILDISISDFGSVRQAQDRFV
jgi:hypothetical protein